MLNNNVVKASRWVWLVYLLAGTLATGAYFLLPSTSVQNVFFDLVAFSAVPAISVGVRMHRPIRPLHWYLFALGLLTIVVGEVVWTYYENVLLVEAPFPSVAGAFYLAGLPCIAAGLWLIGRERPAWGRWADLTDALIVATVAGMISWIFLMDSHAYDQTQTLLGRLISIAYPLADLVLLVVVLRLLLSSERRLPAHYLLGASLVFMLVADTAYAALLRTDAYETGHPIDAGWSLFYVLFGVAALHPSMVGLSERMPDTETKLTWGRLALLTMTLLVAPVLLAYQASLDERIDVSVIVGGTAMLFVLVMVRLFYAIGEHERAEDALRESEERFHSLIQNVSDLITIIDSEGVMVYQSPAAERMFGYKAEELIGIHVTQGFELLVHPDDLERVQKTCAEVVDEPSFTPTVELRVRQRDGSWRHVEAIGNNLLHDPNLRGIVINTRDITERKWAEDALRESEERYRQLVELSPETIAVHSEGKFVYINAAVVKLFGAAKTEELIGKPVLDFVHPDHIELVKARIRQAQEEAKPMDLTEIKVVCLDGEIIDVETKGIPVTYKGRPATQVVIRDITERKRAEEEIKEANRRLRELAVLKADFTAMIAHEIDTPLAVIQGYADMLSAGKLDPAERSQALAKIRAEIDVLRMHVDDVRAAAVIEREDFTIEPEQVLVDTLLDEAARFAATLPGDHRLVIENDADERVWADPHRIGQVLRNLLSNAAKYSPEGAPIELRARSSERPGRVRIEVADRGYGVHPDDVSRVFEKFGRGRDRLGRRMAGVGLGLYLSRRIMRAHGGDLTLEPALGGGSVFGFELEAVR